MADLITKKYLSTAGFKDYIADLTQNLFATLLYTPKILHNLFLRHSKPLSNFIGLGGFFDSLGIGINLIFKDREPKGRDWYSNYFLFGTWVNALKYLRPTPNFPLLTTHFWGGVVGALIQGFDDCPAQERLGSKYPKTAAAIGFANGVMCCFLQSACINFFNSYLPFPKEANSSLGFVATWALSSKLMCNVEQLAFKVAEKNHVPTPGCCCAAAPPAVPPTAPPPASTKHIDALRHRELATAPAR